MNEIHDIGVLLTKPALAGVSAFLLDRYVLGGLGSQSNAFAFSVFTGTLVGDATIRYTVRQNNFKNVEMALTEVGASSFLALVGDKFFFNPDITRDDTVKRLGTVVASNVIAGYVDSMIVPMC